MYPTDVSGLRSSFESATSTGGLVTGSGVVVHGISSASGNPPADTNSPEPGYGAISAGAARCAIRTTPSGTFSFARTPFVVIGALFGGSGGGGFC